MTTGSRAKVLGGVILLLVLVGIAALLWLRSRPPADKNDTPQETAAYDPDKYSDMETTQVNPGRFFDYQMDKGPLADAIRDLISVALVSQYKDDAVNILLRDIEWAPDTATLVLRSGIYWSDGKPFTARHVVEAFSRFVRQSGTKDFEKTADTAHWRTLTMHTEGSERVIIAGFSDKGNLVKLLASNYMRPYRGDLGQGDQDLNEAFLASLGPYRVSDVNVTTLTVPGALRLLPNDVYYKGPKQEPLDFDLVPVFKPQ